jgi:hypothetical protein
MTTGHLSPNLVGISLRGGNPCEVKRIMGRFRISINRDHIGEAHSVLTWVVKARDIRVGKVFGNSERRGVGRKSRQRKRPKILFDVTQKGVSDPFAK